MNGFDRIEIHAVDHCTQRCRHCSHAADIAPRRFYQPADYVPWLRSMADQGIHWTTIDVLGGEPFLLPNLAEFVAAVGQYSERVGTMSNLFWLRSSSDIDRHARTLERLNHLVVTYYQPIVDRAGGIDYVRCLVHQIRERFEGLKIWAFVDAVVDQFAAIEFGKVPRPIANAECNFRKCVQLLDDGRLLHCCAARRILAGGTDFDPAELGDAVFNASGQVDRQALREWLELPVLELCQHCSLATRGVELVDWRQRGL